MKNIVFAIIGLCITFNLHAQDYIQKIKDELQEIPYIIEGEVVKVELYGGDDEGNRLSDEYLKWEGGIGYWYQSNGKRAIGYSKATIKICKIYKGNLEVEEGYIDILTYSDMVHPFVGIKDGQRLTFYDYFAPSHGGMGKQFLSPGTKGQRLILFVKENNKPSNTLTLSNIGRIVYDLGYDGNGYGYTRASGLIAKLKEAYPQKELDKVLDQFPSININGKNFCEDGDVKKKVLDQETSKSK